MAMTWNINIYSVEQKYWKPIAYLTSLAGVDPIMEATSFVSTDTAEDGCSIEFCCHDHDDRMKKNKRHFMRIGFKMIIIQIKVFGVVVDFKVLLK